MKMPLLSQPALLLVNFMSALALAVFAILSLLLNKTILQKKEDGRFKRQFCNNVV